MRFIFGFILGLIAIYLAVKIYHEIYPQKLVCWGSYCITQETK